MSRHCAIFTIAQDEGVRLPIWLEHYAKTGMPLYVLNHQSQPHHLERMQAAIAEQGATQFDVFNNVSFSHEWLRDTVDRFYRFLLQSYKYVLFAEVDEIIAPRPGSGYRDLGDYLQNFNKTAVCCSGYEVVQVLDDEPDLDYDQRPLLAQRRMWYPSQTYSKPLLSSVPLTWDTGFHKAAEIGAHMRGMVDPALLLLHLHKIDFALIKQRNEEIVRKRQWSEAGVDRQAGFQNRLVDDAELRQFWATNVDTPFNPETPQPLEEMPDAVRQIL